MDEYKRKNKYVLGVPWGSTPIPFFNAFSALVKKDNTNLAGMHLVMMDEYVVQNNGDYSYVDPDAQYCGHYRIEHDLLEKLPPESRKKINIHFPSPNDTKEFERFIESIGGIDLFIIAAGAEDGHVAMNGPGTSLESRTRFIDLSETVRDYNFQKYKNYFGNDKKNVPRHGVTVGLRTLLTAKELLFVAHGSEKARIVKILCDANGFDNNYPVTFLCRAKEKTQIFIDEAAARNVINSING